MDSNPRSLVLEATALPTTPQTLPGKYFLALSVILRPGLFKVPAVVPRYDK